MEKAQDYQRRAAKCRDMIAFMRTPEQKQQLEEIALAWDLLARERMELNLHRRQRSESTSQKSNH